MLHLRVKWLCSVCRVHLHVVQTTKTLRLAQKHTATLKQTSQRSSLPSGPGIVHRENVILAASVLMVKTNVNNYRQNEQGKVRGKQNIQHSI